MQIMAIEGIQMTLLGIIEAILVHNLECDLHVVALIFYSHIAKLKCYYL